MARETELRAVTFESRGEDGLAAILARGAAAVASDEFDSGGWLELAPVATGSSGAIRVEAAYSDDGLRRSLAKLDVHLRAPVARLDPELVRDAVANFGGGEYTNLCFVGAPPLDPASAAGGQGSQLPEDTLDVTITYPARFAYYARNTLLAREGWSAEERATALECLRMLGVAFRPRAAGVAVSTHQLRRRMTVEAQVSALLFAAERHASAALFTAMIPPRRSLRVALGARRPSDEPARELALCVSHGLTADRETTSEEVAAVERFATRNFGSARGVREWRVQSRK